MSDCQCEQPGFCPLRGIKMNRRFWEFCQGTSGLSRDKELAYLATLESSQPNIINKVSSLTKSLVDYALSGFKNSEPSERERRLNICNSCEYFNKEKIKCNKCGCGLSLKVRLKSSHCPIGKW